MEKELREESIREQKVVLHSWMPWVKATSYVFREKMRSIQHSSSSPQQVRYAEAYCAMRNKLMQHCSSFSHPRGLGDWSGDVP